MANIKHRRATSYANIYTNNIRISYSPYDLTLVCSQNEIGEDNELVMEEYAKINMSLEHAKRLARLLTDTLAQVEREFGHIPDFEAQRQRQFRLEQERGQ